MLKRAECKKRREIMEFREKTNSTVEMLIKNEETASVLYKVYAERFQEERDFWNSLAEEEKTHASWIEKFYNDNKNLVSFNDQRFKPELFNISLDYMSEKLNEANSEDSEITLKDALSIALGLETGMIERGYFEVFETDSPELKKTLQSLSDATLRHTEKIREKVFKIKGPS